MKISTVLVASLSAFALADKHPQITQFAQVARRNNFTMTRSTTHPQVTVSSTSVSVPVVTPSGGSGSGGGGGNAGNNLHVAGGAVFGGVVLGALAFL